MKRKNSIWVILTISLFLVVTLCLNSLHAIDDTMPRGKEFSSRLKNIRKSTYTVFSFSFYVFPESEDKSFGAMVGRRGRGFIKKQDPGDIFISVKHVLEVPEKTLYGPPQRGVILERKEDPYVLAFPDYCDAQAFYLKFTNYLKTRTMNGFNWYDDYLKALKEFESDIERAIRLDHGKLVHAKGVSYVQEAAYIPIDKKYSEKISGLPPEYFPDKIVLDYDQEVGIWGCPNQFGEFWRRGVISNPNWIDANQLEFQAVGETGIFHTYHEYAVCDIIVAPGDSGSPMVASTDGQLKIIGVTTATFSRPPRLGIFYKIDCFFRSLKL